MRFVNYCDYNDIYQQWMCKILVVIVVDSNQGFIAVWIATIWSAEWTNPFTSRRNLNSSFTGKTESNDFPFRNVRENV